MAGPRTTLATAVAAYLARLRFPTLFVLALVVLALDLLVPDGLPFLDEALLALGAALLGSWKKQRDERRQDDRVIDV